MNFFEQLIIGVLFISGLWAACAEGMIFGELADMAEKILPRELCKPLFVCPACMSSIWGTLVWFYTGGSFYLWPIYIFCLCGAMHLVSIHLLQNNER